MKPTRFLLPLGALLLVGAALECAIRERMRELVECILEEELEESLGARRSERSEGRHGYRHGSKSRSLALRSGKVELRVPRARLAKGDGPNQPSCGSSMEPSWIVDSASRSSS